MNGPTTGKTVLITGATAGIGKATALELARQVPIVAIVGRDADKPRSVAAEISATTANPAVEPWTADLSSQAEIRQFALELMVKTRCWTSW